MKSCLATEPFRAFASNDFPVRHVYRGCYVLPTVFPFDRGNRNYPAVTSAHEERIAPE